MSTVKLFRSIIMGPPGSGKGTISERIIKDFSIKHLSSGDLLRQNIESRTNIGVDAKNYIDNGKLVPDKVIISLICENLKKLQKSNWLLDGFPRNLDQAKALQDIEPIETVINLNVPFEVILNRIKGRWIHLPSGRVYHTEFNPPKIPNIDDLSKEPLVQREDDKEETVKIRLQSYHDQTGPVLDFYRDLGILKEFSGNYTNEIWPQVFLFISKRIVPLQQTEYT